MDHRTIYSVNIDNEHDGGVETLAVLYASLDMAKMAAEYQVECLGGDAGVWTPDPTDWVWVEDEDGLRFEPRTYQWGTRAIWIGSSSLILTAP